MLRDAYGVHLHFLEGRAAPDQPELLEDVHHHEPDWSDPLDSRWRE